MANNFRIRYLLVIIAAVILTPCFFAYAQSDVGGNKDEIEALNKEIAAKKDKIQQLEETINNYKKNIEKKQLEAVSLNNQMSILDNRIAQLDVDIEATGERIKQAQLEIEALQLSIEDKENSISKQKKIISQMVRKIQAEDRKNYIEIMLTNDNFADFYNQLQNLEDVYSELGRSVKRLRLAKEDLDAKKQQVDSKKQTFQNLQNQLQEKRTGYNDQVKYKQNLLIQTRSSEQRYRTLVSSLQQQYKQTESEVRSYEEQVRKKLEQQDKLPEGSAGPLAWPVPSKSITARFHDTDYPYRNIFEHSGLDIRASHGTAVRAAASGYVARAKRCSLASCYAYVLIVHTGNISTLYGHLSKISVNDDQFVNKGDIIGYSGGTPGTVGAGPFVTGPHLHFETRLNGIPADPINYLIQ